MIKVAVVGYGNVGRYAVQAVRAASDLQLVGVVRSSDGIVPPELEGLPVVSHVSCLPEKPQVVLLCVPSRTVPSLAPIYLSQGICTVDSFDVHPQIWETRLQLEAVAKTHGVAAILSAGWDPGTDSVVRALMEVCTPKGLTYTDFGPGMSMGHTVAVKKIAGVHKALSMTIPLGTGLHRRMVYVELEPGCSLQAVTEAVLQDPYFAQDETHVIQVPSVDALLDMGHGVHMVRKGVSGITQNQHLAFDMSINNPALTAQILVGAARAVLLRKPGCYTLLEVPVADLLPGTLQEKIVRMV